jgi:hypothetical protein
MKRLIAPSLACAAFMAACSPGKGSAKFTTWGEEYIEEMIPADPNGEDGFIDGWTLQYTKFLVAIHGIEIARSDGEVGAKMTGSKLIDNVQPGRKDLVSFLDLDAVEWDRVSYQIKPAEASSELVGATEADRTMMVANGYSMYIEGSATKDAVTKSFQLGYTLGTQYKDCQQAEESGQAIQGIVITEGGTDVSELTTHGDHFFYDRLKASEDPAVKTVLRFDEKAAADVDNDGMITQAELDAVPIDVRKYDPSGFNTPTLGSFMNALSRTVGHFRGEGECSVSEAE